MDKKLENTKKKKNKKKNVKKSEHSSTDQTNQTHASIEHFIRKQSAIG
jgi:hypothetical protein